MFIEQYYVQMATCIHFSSDCLFGKSINIWTFYRGSKSGLQTDTSWVSLCEAAGSSFFLMGSWAKDI